MIIIIILIVIGALSEGRSPAAPEELSIADLEKYKEISHKVLTVWPGEGPPDQSDQQREVRCFSLSPLNVFRLDKKVFNPLCFAWLALS